MSTSCPATTGKVVLNSNDRSRIDFSSDYVEWGAYLVPESVCLLGISHSKCCRSGEITRGDICNGFIFRDHQNSTHRVIDNITSRRTSNTDFFCCGGDATELFCAVFTWCGRTPDLNGDCRCFCCCVDALANPGPLLELPSHKARGVNFILAFSPGIPAQSLNCNLKVLILVSALISEIYTSPKLMVDSLAVPSSVNIDVQVPISMSVVTVRPILSVLHVRKWLTVMKPEIDYPIIHNIIF